MAKQSGSLRLYLTQADARAAVRDALTNGRIKWNIREESDSRFKVKQRATILWAPVRLEIGLRRESPTTTIVLLNGTIRGFLSDAPRLRLESHMAKFADDIEAHASKYVSQQ